MNRRGKIIAIVLVMAAVVFGIGGYVYATYFKKAPSAATFLPKDTAFYLSLNTSSHDNQVEAFRSLYNGYSGKGLVKTTLERSVRSIYSVNDLRYDQDIRPWLGEEVAVAKISNKSDSQILFLAHVKSIRAAKKSIDNIQSRMQENGGNVQTQTVIYKKIPYSKITFSDKEVVISFVKGYLIAAFNEEDIKTLIDVSKKNAPSLESHEEYKSLVQKFPDERIASVYVTALPFETKQVSATSLGTFGGSFVASEQGVQTTFVFPGQQIQQVSKVSDPISFTLMPQDTPFFFETQSVEQFAQIAHLLANQHNDFDTFISNIERTIGISLAKDLFAIGDKRFVAGLMPGVSTQSFDIGFIFEPSNIEDAKSHIASFETALKSHARKGETFQDITYKSTSIRHLPLDVLAIDLNYAIVQDKIILSNSTEGMHTLIDVMNKNRNSMESTPDFTKGFNTLEEKRGQGMIFVESKGLILTAAQALESYPSLNTQLASLLLQFFKSLTFTSAQTEQGTTISGFLLAQ